MINFTQQEIKAKEEMKGARGMFRTKRVTKLVRISSKWYGQVKNMDSKKLPTMSKRLDFICEVFFKNNPRFFTRERKETADEQRSELDTQNDIHGNSLGW